MWTVPWPQLAMQAAHDPWWESWDALSLGLWQDMSAWGSDLVAETLCFLHPLHPPGCSSSCNQVCNGCRPALFKELMNISEKEKLTVPSYHLPPSFVIPKYLMLATDLFIIMRIKRLKKKKNYRSVQPCLPRPTTHERKDPVSSCSGWVLAPRKRIRSEYVRILTLQNLWMWPYLEKASLQM